MDNKLVLYVVAILVYYIYREYAKQQAVAKSRQRELEQGTPTPVTNEMRGNEEKSSPAGPPQRVYIPKETKVREVKPLILKTPPSRTAIVVPQAKKIEVAHSLEIDGAQHKVHTSMVNSENETKDVYEVETDSQVEERSRIQIDASVLRAWVIGSEIMAKPAWQKY